MICHVGMYALYVSMYVIVYTIPLQSRWGSRQQKKGRASETSERREREHPAPSLRPLRHHPRTLKRHGLIRMLHNPPVPHERRPAHDVPHEHTCTQTSMWVDLLISSIQVSISTHVSTIAIAKNDHSQEYEPAQSIRPIRARVHRTGTSATLGHAAYLSRRRTRYP